MEGLCYCCSVYATASPTSGTDSHTVTLILPFLLSSHLTHPEDIRMQRRATTSVPLRITVESLPWIRTTATRFITAASVTTRTVTLSVPFRISPKCWTSTVATQMPISTVVRRTTRLGIVRLRLWQRDYQGHTVPYARTEYVCVVAVLR